MIGSFWNLCRACPSMPVDKLHSEYRSTYRWHEYTGPRQEVVRRPPQSNAVPATGEKMNDIHHSTKTHEEESNNDFLPKLEPTMPRRKKYPDLAYRHNEFMVRDNVKMNGYVNNADSRARSEERCGSNWRPSRRSKSEGPKSGVNGDALREREPRRESDPDVEYMGRENGLLQKAMSKLNTEYRLQFAWPQGHLSRIDAAGSSPRKSKSMGTLKQNANAMVHRRRIDLENRDASELEPLVDEKNTREEKGHIYKNDAYDDDKFNTEYKKKFRPFSQYEYSEGKFTTKRSASNDVEDGPTSLPIDCEKGGDSWYREVVELRKKAGEYKHRGWGSEFESGKASDIYNKQVELWDQVSRRSSLSALSLASMAHKNYTKEEKEEDNNKKSSPSKASRNAENSARIMRDIVRHHLERTTGGSELDGLILSPTREKLEPTIPRKDEDFRGSTKNSPKKSSPLKSSSLKRSNQKAKKARNLRSQSVGPIETGEKKSPKRQSRSATVKERKSSASLSSTRRPRPSSLNTNASPRSKSSSVPSKTDDEPLAKSKTKKIELPGHKIPNKDVRKGTALADSTKQESQEEVKETTEEKDVMNYEPVIKSPPEPTRVKSPEQILMRSPDPVNWTVPLDTGKTFTVTQNVREGDIGSRPHSEIKAWTPPEVPSAIPATAREPSKEPAMS